jgi:hypothetical protein
VKHPADDESATASVGETETVGDPVFKGDVGVRDSCNVGVAVGVAVGLRVGGISDG